MKDIEEVIAKEDWKFLVKNFLPVNFADSLDFVECMHLVGSLTMAAADEIQRDGFTADLFRDFAVNLMIILRAKNPNEWQKDWKNEAFLGMSCALVYREEEGFEYIKNVFDKLIDPPQSLLFAYLSAGSRPGLFLTEKEIFALTEQAVNKGITFESASRMASLEKRKGNQSKYQYWKLKIDEAEKNKLHTPFITPNVLKSMFQLDEGYQHEE